MSTKERIIPSESLIKWRSNYLSKLKRIKPIRPKILKNIRLSEGNKKTGKTGKKFKKIFVWNLPSVVTCPGASVWCLKHCYNADDRDYIFTIKEWAKNWWMIENRINKLQKNIINQISQSEKPIAIRIHSSGDFYTQNYINLWINIAHNFENVIFWAYTRSWTCTDLLPSLEQFQSMKNVELFASWDNTMAKEPPAKWRKSFVYVNEKDILNHHYHNSRALICPEQIGKVDNCAACGFCMKRKKKDIIFYFH